MTLRILLTSDLLNVTTINYCSTKSVEWNTLQIENDIWSKFSTEYHFRIERCFIQLILYCNRLLLSRLISLKSTMFSTSYFSFSLIIIDDDDEMIWFKCESLKSFRSKKIWKIEWIFISLEKFNLKNVFIFFNTLNNSSIL